MARSSSRKGWGNKGGYSDYSNFPRIYCKDSQRYGPKHMDIITLKHCFHPFNFAERIEFLHAALEKYGEFMRNYL